MNERDRYFTRENPTAAYKGEWQANQYVNSIVGCRRLPTTEDIIKELNRRVLSPLLFPETRDRFAGVYRTRDILGVVGSGLSMPPSYKVPELMKNYGETMDGKLSEIKCNIDLDTEDFIRNMGYAHYELVKIHPFIDGNGRVARHTLALMCKLACKKPIVIAPVHRKAYLNSLEKVNVTGNLDHLNKFLAERWLESFSNGNDHERKEVTEIRLFINSRG